MADSASSVPLLVTAELPSKLFAWAEGLRRAHFPPERNKVRAHVTLFHALPPSVEGELRRMLAELARAPPPPARIVGLMPLGGGTAFEIASPELQALHAEMVERLHGVLSVQDRGRPKLHVTVQNKVPPAEAKALQAALAEAWRPDEFAFAGLSLHRYLGGRWEDAGTWPFRGPRR
ncbi:MAG: 2'-5' RNA ligase family protein [Novosphingobium sp.]|nr:2'-5' RNA ligase family protein [Novosphingobium sp.]